MSRTLTLNPAALVRARFRRWWEARLPRTDSQLLTQGNVYILPTRAGWLFGLTLNTQILPMISKAVNVEFPSWVGWAGAGAVWLAYAAAAVVVIVATRAAAAAPERTLVDISDVGSLAAFLVSDAARRITGTIIPVDGGQHLIA